MTDAGLVEGASARLHDVARVIGRYCFRPAFRIRVHGRDRVPRTGSVLLIANHSSLVEPPVIFGMLPRRSVFLVKEEIFTGAVGWFLRRIGQVPIRRGEPDRAPLLTTAQVLREGGLVGVFPEGTRGTGDVTSAERGAAWLIRACADRGVVVLPVATRGTQRPANGRRRFRPLVDVLVGEPFTVEVGKGRAGLIQATERLRAELASLVRTLDDMRAAGPRTEQKAKS